MHKNTFLTALVVWREASGESPETCRGVAHVIYNRVARPGWWGKTLFDVVTKRSQFTSMVPPVGRLDPNLTRYPNPDDPSWQSCLDIAEAMWSNPSEEDPTNGATFYFDKSLDTNPPIWVASYRHTCDIGNIHFYSDQL